MFRSIEQLNLDNDNDDNQCTCNNDNEITDENMLSAATALSAINNITETKAFETLTIWMVLYAGISRQVQRRDF